MKVQNSPKASGNTGLSTELLKALQLAERVLDAITPEHFYDHCNCDRCCALRSAKSAIAKATCSHRHTEDRGDDNMEVLVCLDCEQILNP